MAKKKPAPKKQTIADLIAGDIGGLFGNIADQVIDCQSPEDPARLSDLINELEDAVSGVSELMTEFGDARLDMAPGDEDNFLQTYFVLARIGACDLPPGMEYERVRREWESRGRPKDIEAFIHKRANWVPPEVKPPRTVRGPRPSGPKKNNRKKS